MIFYNKYLFFFRVIEQYGCLEGGGYLVLMIFRFQSFFLYFLYFINREKKEEIEMLYRKILWVRFGSVVRKLFVRVQLYWFYVMSWLSSYFLIILYDGRGVLVFGKQSFVFGIYVWRRNVMGVQKRDKFNCVCVYVYI